MAVLGCLILILSWVGIRALVTPINPDGSLCAVGISGSALLGPAPLPCGLRSTIEQIRFLDVGFVLSPQILTVDKVALCVNV